MLTLKLAIRNLLRNTRRTLLTIMLIGFSLTALILTDALTLGMTRLMVENVTDSLTGDAQIHHNQFSENQNINFFISDVGSINRQLLADENVLAVANRVISGTMISSPYNVTAGALYGVDAEAEISIGKLRDSIVQGRYLSGSSRELLLGESMAKLLEVKLGDRIVLTLAEAGTGELTQALFRVNGIFNFGVREIDENLVFINLDKAREIMKLTQNQSHEIVIKLRQGVDARNKILPLYANFNKPQLKIQSWLELNPELASIIEMSAYSSAIVGSILFLLATLGVINSLFMSIYERIYEFGVIRAIGARPADLSRLIILEAFCIAILACILGAGLSFVVSLWTSVNGIPFGEMEFSGIAINNNVKTVSNLSQYINYPLYVIILTLLTSLYPAYFAAKIVPSKALSKSL